MEWLLWCASGCGSAIRVDGLAPEAGFVAASIEMNLLFSLKAYPLDHSRDEYGRDKEFLSTGKVQMYITLQVSSVNLPFLNGEITKDEIKIKTAV